LSDWASSAYKRFHSSGIRGLLPRAKMKKRKAKTRSRQSGSKTSKSRTK
jgi:hypothetical protein